MASAVLCIGTFDTKARELGFVRAALQGQGLEVRGVDVSTGRSGSALPGPRDVTAEEVAACHPKGASAVLGLADRGQAVAAMAEALALFLPTFANISGAIGIGGGGGTSIITAGLRTLPYGLPKIMVSTLASGNTAPYVGISDLIMIPAVTDFAGLNPLNRTILHNAAQALAGMVRQPAPDAAQASKPALGLTMFGVTTACVTALAEGLPDYDCMVFHATGTGGRTMEKLADDGMLAGFLDITTTEVADLICGGTLACDADRFGAVARTCLPWLGSTGALDMVNFGAPETVPAAYQGRHFYHHNPQVTLMRTTEAENAAIGAWIAGRLNLCEGPVCLMLPEGGISALDRPGGPFHDPACSAALFGALETNLRSGPRRQIIRMPHHINDPAFVTACLTQFRML